MPVHQNYYRSVLANYGVSLPEFARILVWLVGLLELLSALLITLPYFRQIGLILAGVILLCYLLAMAANLLQGKVDMDCGCFGPASQTKISAELLLRNAILIGLLVMAAAPAFQATTKEAMQLGANDWTLSALLAAMLILLNLTLEQVIANTQKLNSLKQVMQG